MFIIWINTDTPSSAEMLPSKFSFSFLVYLSRLTRNFVGLLFAHDGSLETDSTILLKYSQLELQTEKKWKRFSNHGLEAQQIIYGSCTTNDSMIISRIRMHQVNTFKETKALLKAIISCGNTDII